jgi:hypothetical protein
MTMKNIRVKVFIDQMGNIIGYPVRRDIQDKIKNHLKDMGGYPDYRFFYQEGAPAEEFKQDLTTKNIKDLELGYDIFINIDPWIVGCFYGYDTHTIFE